MSSNYLLTVLRNLICLVSLFFFIALLAVTFQDQPVDFLGHADRIYSLPGVSAGLHSRHYSGYLDALNGVRLFYWFIESQANPQADPVLLWLTGSGCSSLLGALAEIGPLRMQPNGSLVVNPFSWNTKASLLFLESSVGTGFSYSTNGTNLHLAADSSEINLIALRSFYGKFPHLAANPFYIAGESSAASSIINLATLLTGQNFPTHLVGIAIGNGQLLHNTTLEKLSHDHFLEHHGISSSHLVRVANSTRIWLPHIHRHCRPVHSQYYSQIYPHQQYQYFVDYWKLHQITSDRPGLLECTVERPLSRWLNRDDVRRALHVEEWPRTFWNVCNRRSTPNYHRRTDSLAPLIRQLAQEGIRVLTYNGDADYLETFVGGKWFADFELAYRLLSKDEPLYFAGHHVGNVYRYESNFTFVQIFNGSHMTAVEQPGPVLAMVDKFLFC